MNTQLSEYAERARTAFNNISFSPEKRGASFLSEFEGILEYDLKQIENATDEQKEWYVKKFKQFFSEYLGAKSRCISSAITGGSNFIFGDLLNAESKSASVGGIDSTSL